MEQLIPVGLLILIATIILGHCYGSIKDKREALRNEKAMGDKIND